MNAQLAPASASQQVTVTVALLEAGVSCDHNDVMFDPDGYGFSDLDLV